jgi:tetratricopeptide (TPR) repeat protein
MNQLAGIAIYDPRRLDRDAFLAGFVARRDFFAFLLDKLRHMPDVAEHHIIVGQRGMGKTSLLLRLAIGIASEPALRARYIPLTFREEQYNVRALDIFWRNCAESLAEWCESEGNKDAAAAIDRDLLMPAWQDSRSAAEAFLAAARQLGGRPVLFVDNLDLILDALTPEQNWELRRTLQTPGGPILFGAATQMLRQSADQKAAFYEFFQPHLLEPLSEAELLQCMGRLADARGEAGKLVREILAAEPQRIRTLHTLTGGNPRVLTLVYQLLERTESETAFSDLELLLDQLTPFYKARVEEYQTELQRAVIDAIALNWHPITSHDLSEATAIEVTTVSPLLIKLKHDGLVEEVQTSGARSGYQLVERFFNIWYLMRHGTRRTRQKVYWLTAFLTSFYAPAELIRMRAESAAEGQSRLHPFYREALEAAGDLWPNARQEVATLDPVSNQLPDSDRGDELRGLANGKDSVAMSMIREALSLRLSGRSEEAISVLDEVVRQFGTSSEPVLHEPMATALVNKGFILGSLGRSEEAITAYDDLVSRFGTFPEPALREDVATALFNKGCRLGALERNEEAIGAYDAVVSRFGASAELAFRRRVASALFNKGWTLGSLGRSEEQITAYDDVVRRFGSSAEPALCGAVGRALINKGVRLGALGRSDEAIEIYDNVVGRFGSSVEPALCVLVAKALIHKAATLGSTERNEETIAVYYDVVNRFGTSAEPEIRSHVLLALRSSAETLNALGRTEDAEAAGRRAVEIDPRDCNAWVVLGNTLFDHTDRLAEAEAAYRSAMSISSTDVTAKVNFAWLLLASDRISEAAAIRASLDELHPVGLALLDAAFELSADNFGAATKHLDAALSGDQELLNSSFSDDLLRLLRIAEARQHGERLITWFVESGQAEQRAPMYAAFLAYVRGEKFLLDFSPEIRKPAERIFRWLASRRKPASDPSPQPKRRRGRPRKRRAT